jgi:protein-S-isoprenylcysteine O-methyltransferase Ste14
MAQSPTTEPPSAVEIEGPQGAEPRPRRTTIPERREFARQCVALILVIIFGIEVLGAMLALWLWPTQLEGLKEIIMLILGPTVALVGSVTGFYFGTQEASQATHTDQVVTTGPD